MVVSLMLFNIKQKLSRECIRVQASNSQADAPPSSPAPHPWPLATLRSAPQTSTPGDAATAMLPTTTE